MKKLMFAAVAAAICGVAAASTAYDYKASVKYVDIKKQSVKDELNRPHTGYIKTIKSATITGYLVTTADCGCMVCTEEGGLKPGFLVVQNKKAKSGVKLFPANLLSKAWATKSNLKNGTTLEAEGYLFAGIGKQAVPAAASPAYVFGDATTRGTYKLFGAYNEQNPASKNFVDAWLDASGFGKAKWTTESIGCVIGSGYCLSNLKGSVIGGMFLCTENDLGEWFLCQGWAGTTDVISGTWQIKANAKLEGVALSELEAEELKTFDKENESDVYELELVKAAGQKIDKGFGLLAVEKNFRETWF